MMRGRIAPLIHSIVIINDGFVIVNHFFGLCRLYFFIFFMHDKSRERSPPVFVLEVNRMGLSARVTYSFSFFYAPHLWHGDCGFMVLQW